uniref:Methyltransferase domain-containing protein n=1 Tax=Candidatus Kentrum sp. LPFa TaxID=2126335 RepID=A0A450XH51_9GAMM|nr:MAG: Methyltransferase domain-containing protein [Candidatus Kentron sp. LPFa]VFK28632.1 MAG: Methyltransferase domain-containing protein [Candidatus Kentron sp. LPFa]
MKPKQRIQWIYQSTDSRELAMRYDEWSKSYEDDLCHLNYTSPEIGVQQFARWVPTTARILDAGAGTGLVGENLSRIGYWRLVGIDNAPCMLDLARAKGVYTELSVQDLLGTLRFPSDTFDAVISIGVFNFCHVDARAFGELIRVTRPEGIILFSVLSRYRREDTFASALRDLEVAAKWRLLEISQPFSSRDKVDKEATAEILVYRVSK